MKVTLLNTNAYNSLTVNQNTKSLKVCVFVCDPNVNIIEHVNEAL